ncbi:MAG: diaminopimelate dehydrogenase [Deferribacteraceae bacterium]|nr:diaminopimelate dehydrogenase [Deferribacteraceae bacterium]
MINVAVSGLGNLGKYAIEALESTTDMQCVGVIRRPESLGTRQLDLRGVPDFDSAESMERAVGKPDVMILCCPSRKVCEEAEFYLSRGYNTVDSFDIHSEISSTVKRVHEFAIKANRASIISAGWDPGTDSVLRAYFEAMAPVGTTFTNFGRGRSMGHSVAAKAIKGVKDAVSITIPMGGGRHSRLVYVVLESGETLSAVTERIKADNYFAHDPLQVCEVADSQALEFVSDASHGVLLERTGGFGSVSNQQFKFDMRINNPALTSQILVSCARAVTRMAAGAYTMIDVPPVHLLAGERFNIIEKLV